MSLILNADATSATGSSMTNSSSSGNAQLIAVDAPMATQVATETANRARASRAAKPSSQKPTTTTTRGKLPPQKLARSPILEPLLIPVAVEPMREQAFDSWEECENAVSAYCARTCQLLSVSTACTAATRNKKIRASLAKKDVQDPRILIPAKFDCYAKSYVCTHSGKPRIRSTGERPRQHHRSIGCPAKIRLCVKRTTYDGPWRVHVTLQVAEHNHIIDEATYARYPAQRRVTWMDARVLEIVDEMRRYGTPRRGIFAFLQKKAGSQTVIAMKDVHNLLAKLKANDQEGAAVGEERDDASQDEDEYDGEREQDGEEQEETEAEEGDTEGQQ